MRSKFPPFLGLFLAGFLSVFARAAAPASSLQLSLEESIPWTLQRSPRYQETRLQYESARRHASAQSAPLLPKLSFDASYKYLDVVPSFRPVPNGPAIKLGDNKNYSYGPAAVWNIYDTGVTYNRWKSAQASARAGYFQMEAAERQLTLETRVAYFEIQLALEQVRVLCDALRLSQEQYDDIHAQQRAGTLSRIDLLSSHQEVLNHRRQLRQARVELAEALRDFFTLTGQGQNTDPSIPFDVASAAKLPRDVEPATLTVTVDSIAQTRKTLDAAAKAPFDEHQPSLESLAQNVEAADRLSRSVAAGHGPWVQVMGKISKDYPNGPILESFTQKTVGVTASLPIFESGHVVNEAKSTRAQAQAADEKRAQTRLDLKRDWQKTRDRLQGYLAEVELNRTAISETETLARLVYDSYRAGRSNYIEVEDANFRALQAKVQSARNDVQILIQLAILDSLSEKTQ